MTADGFPGRLSAALGRRHPVTGVAVLEPGVPPRTASRGLAPGADLEIGSVSKALTGLLYADAVRRGDVTPTTRLAELLPLADVPAGAVTLQSLSTHTSGLPRLPSSMQPLRRTLDLWRHGTNPYGDTREVLLDQARSVRLGRPRPSYSNLGYELLGHALAAAAGTTYAALLDERLCRPLGMSSTYVPARVDELRATAVTGRSARGRQREAWTGEAVGPAGGVRSTVADMARLLEALLDGSAPGVEALEPVERFGPGARIGAAWLTVEVRGRTVTWHNGRTGGFASWIGVDRAAGRGAVLLSATSRSVDRPGFDLLLDDRGPGGPDDGPGGT